MRALGYPPQGLLASWTGELAPRRRPRRVSPSRKLSAPLEAAGMAKSSYLYQKRALSKPNKHADLRARVTEIFHGNDGRYGYRRIHSALKMEEVAVSEKAACRLMRDAHLVAKRPAKRKHSSCKGEISDAPENIANRDFHADSPTRLGSPSSRNSPYPPARPI